jgi:hypothetical protein
MESLGLHIVAFGLVAEVTLEQGEEIVHFDSEFLAKSEPYSW